MKLKSILVVLTIMTCGLLSLQSCTEQSRVRNFGGTLTIKLPKGQKLLMATWKETSLFYLMEPMDSTYVPKDKTFKEDSSFGVMESTIIFKECR